MEYMIGKTEIRNLISSFMLYIWIILVINAGIRCLNEEVHVRPMKVSPVWMDGRVSVPVNVRLKEATR